MRMIYVAFRSTQQGLMIDEVPGVVYILYGSWLLTNLSNQYGKRIAYIERLLTQGLVNSLQDSVQTC